MTTTLYIDGACKYNNQRNNLSVRKAGIGIFVDQEREDEPVRHAPMSLRPVIGVENQFWYSEPLVVTPQHPATNNRAELQAAIRALELIGDKSIKLQPGVTLIVTDSELLYNTVTDWLPNAWRKSNYHKRDGKVVANVDLVMELDEWLKKLSNRISWVHMNSHQKEPTAKDSREWRRWHGNKTADRLANDACKK